VSDLSNSLTFSSQSWVLQERVMELSPHGIPLSDRGFRYGQHFFETVAVRHGTPLFVEQHIDRLLKAAKKHHFGTDTEWQQSLSHFLTTTPFQDGVVRIFLTAGEGGLGEPVVNPRIVALWEVSSFPSIQKMNQGIKVISLTKHIGSKYWGIKNGNYWDHICALQEARKEGAEEGLVFNEDGFLISGAISNVILWLEEEGELNLMTPSPLLGAREGVVLDWAHKQLPQMIECDISRADLSQVRAMVITNSRLGVMPVAMLDGVRLPHYNLGLELARKYHSLHGF